MAPAYTLRACFNFINEHSWSPGPTQKQTYRGDSFLGRLRPRFFGATLTAKYVNINLYNSRSIDYCQSSNIQTEDSWMFAIPLSSEAPLT